MAVVAEFSARPVSGCVPLFVQFTDLSTGNPDEWAWDFGVTDLHSFLDTVDTVFKDTADTVWKDHIFLESSGDQNPSFVYTEIGVYTVTLVATLAGDSDTKIKTSYIVVVTNILPRPDLLYSGVKEGFFGDGWENDKHFILQQSNPFPCVVHYFDLYVSANNE